jgi:TonB family protein
VSRREPLYPEEAKRAGAKGTVTLDATIGVDGHVTEVRVIQGHPLLQAAAVEAVKQWTYRPTVLNGKAVETQTQIVLNFVGEAPRSGSFERAELISRIEPVHPGGELQHLAGTIVFRATVGVDGRLSNIRAVDGPAELVPAALDAVRQWVYRPSQLNGRPVETETQIALRFEPQN